MNEQVFGAAYASQYDAIYHAKDYEAEADLLMACFDRHANGKVESVLDLGCGTGNHALPLARRGLRVRGVERADDMLAIARGKAVAERPMPSVSFSKGDLRTFRGEERYDAALMMFAVLGYQTSNEDVLAALRTARANVRPNGLFVADVWYGPAVLAQRPGTSVKVYPAGNARLIRTSIGKLDVLRHCVAIDIRTLQISEDRLVSEATETHAMRFFFPQEMDLLLTSTGFALVSLTAWPTLDEPPTESDWNVLIVARAV